jgi:N-acyl-L-homoserine lactone synthetase
MTWDNGSIFPIASTPTDTPMPHLLRRVFARTVHHPSPSARPWEWERLATPEEITRVKTDMRRAA